MPRYRRYFGEHQTVFLTLATAQRRPWLSGDGVRAMLLDVLRDTRRQHPFRHHGHVLLHDHLHLLVSPQAGTSVPRLIASFKQGVLAQMRVRPDCVPARMWQPRYYDHIIRDDEDFARHLDYLHFNPVKHGLVAKPSQWPWSSFSEWHARGAYTDDWGSIEPKRIRGLTE